VPSQVSEANDTDVDSNSKTRDLQSLGRSDFDRVMHLKCMSYGKHFGRSAMLKNSVLY
jgi:hypothetical protein